MKILDIPQSGKQGLNVSMNGRNGLIRRALAIPANPRTSAQKNIRSSFASASENWDGLTQEQCRAWIAAASGMKSKSRLGQSGPLTGNQLFVKVNALNLDLGYEVVTDPPVRSPFEANPVTGLTITNTAGAIALKLTQPNPFSVAHDGFVLGSKPVKSGQFVQNNACLLGAIPAAANGVVNITALYTAKFGVPPVGTKVFVSVFQYKGGYEDLPVQFSALVPAA